MVTLASSSPAYNIKQNDVLDEGWQRVKGRKGNRSEDDKSHVTHDSFVAEINSDDLENPKSKASIVDRMAMTIFITNFPFQISNKEIWDKCCDWGKVVDVFIAKRRSKAGKPFGFVRFIRVENAEKLIDGLRSIWFDNLRMFADIEKYPRNKSQKLMESKGATNKAGCSRSPSPIWKEKDEIQKSYVEVLSGVKGNTSSKSVSKRRTVRIYTNDSESVSKFSPDLLLKINEPRNIPYDRQWFHDEGFVDVEISYVGGRWVYMMFSSPEAKDLFFSNELLKLRFCSVKAPCVNFVPDERMVWVEISGIPKDAWFESNFQVVLESWGKCIFVASEWGEACSMGKVCVLTQSANFIYEELNAVLDDKSYDIWIREFAVWEPDILKISYTASDSENGCIDQSIGDRGNDAIQDNADVNPSTKVSLESNQHTCFPEVVEELSSLDKSSAKDQDKCRVGPVKATAFENVKVPSESPIKQDQSINESTGSGKHNQVTNQIGDHLFSSKVTPSTPPATDLNPTEESVSESVSTRLDYVRPLITKELDLEICWNYKEPCGKVQGPSSLAQLHKWKDQFPSDFKI